MGSALTAARTARRIPTCLGGYLFGTVFLFWWNSRHDNAPGIATANCKFIYFSLSYFILRDRFDAFAAKNASSTTKKSAVEKWPRWRTLGDEMLLLYQYVQAPGLQVLLKQ